jgi:hypothetical protein
MSKSKADPLKYKSGTVRLGPLSFADLSALLKSAKAKRKPQIQREIEKRQKMGQGKVEEAAQS